MQVFLQASLDRVLELNFESCIGCLYRWKLLGNSHTKRIRVSFDMYQSADGTKIDFDLASQSVGKEFINPHPELAGGNGIMRYRFKASKPGKATLTFDYGYRTHNRRCLVKS
jgi:hypothetical protein